MPAFFYVCYILILGQHSIMIDVVIMETTMAPMITGSILASTYGLKPKLSSMIGFGIPLSFVTLAFLVFSTSISLVFICLLFKFC
jgi:predicted permease